MHYLVDTSVLVRAVHRRDPACSTARRALTSLSQSDHRLCVLPQNLAELWFVCTRPVASNGLGFSYARTNAYVEQFERYFDMFFETPAVYAEWRSLLGQHRMVGRQLFDARLAAAALVHSFDRVLTFDVEHFRRYEGLELVHPADVSKQTPG